MTKYYKLTDEKDCTRDTQWGAGVTHKATGTGKEMCSAAVIHVYDHPLKAVMFNQIHANFTSYHLWEVQVKQVVANDKLKAGVKQCTTVRQIKAPIITTNQRVKFAILCALKVYKGESFVSWANNWLSGKDRTESAARSAESAAWSAAESTARSAESAAWSAAESAAWAAAESAAESAAWSARSVWAAARSAESAAESAAIDFVALIKQAME